MLIMMIVAICVITLVGAIYMLSNKPKNDVKTVAKEEASEGENSEDMPPPPEGMPPPPDGMPPDMGPSDEEVEEILNSTEKIIKEFNGENLNKTGQDETVFAAEQNSEVTIKNSEFLKSGDSSNLGESDKAGLNAAIKATQLSKIIIEDSKVTTEGKGATGIAAVGTRAILNLTNVDVITKADRSKGILATKKGQIVADNINIETTGYKSSAIATDMGGGNIEVKNSNILTDNIDSAGIYATGNVKAENTVFTTKQAESICIDGSGTVDLINVVCNAFKKRGAMLYYTGPTDRSSPEGRLNITNGEMNVEDGPVFYVMNSSGVINLDNVKITNKSGKFLLASVDRFAELGQEGQKVESKGGSATINAKNQEINGDFEIDEQSTLELNLSENSNLVGSINKENTAKQVNVVLREGCTWTLTADSYVTSLDVIDETTQINLNGYQIYYLENEI